MVDFCSSVTAHTFVVWSITLGHNRGNHLENPQWIRNELVVGPARSCVTTSWNCQPSRAPLQHSFFPASFSSPSLSPAFYSLHVILCIIPFFLCECHSSLINWIIGNKNDGDGFLSYNHLTGFSKFVNILKSIYYWLIHNYFYHRILDFMKMRNRVML